MSTRLLAIAFALSACHGPEPPALHARKLFPLGNHLVVLAPHPDDEVLASAGAIQAAIRSGARVTVVVATDGEAGRDHSGVVEALGPARQAETRSALARIGLPREAVRFLGYADGRLAAAWSERWTAIRPDGQSAPAGALIDALRAAFGDDPPTTILLPAALDEHGDHRALGRLGLLALLRARAEWGTPHVLGYLVHGGRGWPERPPADACTRELSRWRNLRLDPDTVAEKRALIEQYRSQVGPALLHFARPGEPYITDVVVHANRAAGAERPGVRRTRDGVVVHVPVTTCLLGEDSGARLRLRFVAGDAVEERVVALGPRLAVTGGAPGEPLHAMHDLQVARRAGAIRVAIPAGLLDRGGAVLEVLAGAPGRPTPAWLLTW